MSGDYNEQQQKQPDDEAPDTNLFSNPMRTVRKAAAKINALRGYMQPTTDKPALPSMGIIDKKNQSDADEIERQTR